MTIEIKIIAGSREASLFMENVNFDENREAAGRRLGLDLIDTIYNVVEGGK